MKAASHRRVGGEAMRSRGVRQILALGALGVLLGVMVPGGREPAAAQIRDQLLYTIGFVPGQILRLSVATPPDSTGGASPREPLRVEVRAFDQDGNVLIETGIELRPGQIRIIDLDRDAIALAGEDGTGRVQVGMQLFFTGKLKLKTGELPAAPALEIVDKSTGKTAAIAIPSLLQSTKSASGD